MKSTRTSIEKAQAASVAARKAAIAIVTVAGSSLLFGLAFPPHRWSGLAWFALVPLLVAMRMYGWRGSCLVMGLWSLMAAYAVGDWMPGAVEHYYEQSRLVGWVVFVLVVGVMAAPFYAAFGLLHATYHRPGCPIWLRPLLAGCAWTSLELGRGRLFFSDSLSLANPWALIGYSQTAWPEAVQVASVGGVYAVSFTVVCFNAAIAELVPVPRAKTPLRSRANAAVLASVPAALSLTFGYTTVSAGESRADTRIALVQGDVASENRWRATEYGANLDRYLRLSGSVLDEGPQLLIWPESAFTFRVEDEPAYQRSLSSLLRGRDLQLLAGGPRAIGSGAGKLFFNSYFLIDRSGRPVARSDKTVLVPFAERFPFFSEGWLERRFGRSRAVSRPAIVQRTSAHASALPQWRSVTRRCSPRWWLIAF